MRRSLILISLVVAFFLVNWLVQVLYKPSEVVGLAEAPFFKTPADTWEAYGHLFRRHATPICTPEFLAAMAQAESSGNPIARTYWVWRWGLNPFEMYRPASSATGLYQITDGTFDLAKEYCVHDEKVVRDGPWNKLDSCWFNGFYNRLVPSHAIEMTSAYLHVRTVSVVSIASKPLSLKQKQNVAAVIHLCGEHYGRSFLKNTFRASPTDSCAGNNIRAYLRKINRFSAVFKKLSMGFEKESRRLGGERGTNRRLSATSAAAKKF